MLQCPKSTQMFSFFFNHKVSAMFFYSHMHQFSWACFYIKEKTLGIHWCTVVFLVIPRQSFKCWNLLRNQNTQLSYCVRWS